MNILEKLNILLSSLEIPIETGLFSNPPPDQYIVITPLTDDYKLFADNLPQNEVQAARLSLFCIGNFLKIKNQIVSLVLDADITITDRRYIGREDDTGYHHYSIDVESNCLVDLTQTI